MLRAAGTALGILAAPISVAWADAAPVAQIAQSVPEYEFNIPAQQLASALEAFADQSGLQLAYSTEDLQGRSASSLAGKYSAEQALKVLLSGSPVIWRFTDSRTIILEKPESSGSKMLDTIRVVASGGDASGRGPVEGYIATTSASATKTGTSLLETPQSISVVTRDQVESQGAQSVVQALRYSSGVAAEIRGSATRYDIPYIRGFGAPSDPIQYQDGLRMLRGPGYALPQVEAYGAERIELLKGPSSTTYGSAMPGGLVNVITKKPTEEARGEVEFLVGSHERYQAAFDVSGPANEDGTILYRLVALGRDSETQVVHTEEQRAYIAPSLTWNATDDTSVTLLTSYQKDPEGGYYGILPTTGSLWDSPAGAQISRDFNDGDPAFHEFDREQVSLGYEFEHRFDDTWLVRHNLRYLSVDSIADDVATLSLASDGHTINRYALATDESASGIASDLQAQAEFDTGPVRHTTLVGFDYQYLDSSQVRDFGLAPSIDYLDPEYGIATDLTLSAFTDQDQTIAQAGLYLQDQASFGNWTVLLGGRFDHVRTDTDNNLTSSNQSQNDNAFSWKSGVVYSFDNGVAPYASYSTSFLPVSGTDYLGDALDPTTAKQYEIGVKYQPQSFNGLFTLAYFDITQEDVVTSVSPISRYQTGEVRSRGIEAEAKVALTERTNVIAALTYTDAEVTESVGFDEGDSPVAIPDILASLWVDHRIEESFLDGVTIGGGARYVGESVGGYSPNAFTVGATRLDMPSYTLFDAMVAYDLGTLSDRLDGVSAQLNVANLTDETYVTCLANNFCNYGNGRTVYATLKYRW
ncbi:TonB-dependent siderophore receptor [Nisaea acidiphila]|uniref:TonB-dependent siderophore receptor n=1 Tax=Nisaea acidiphila TaxID=1862145 RepID=A0A9J7AMK9_9PROT|nr:TonB-dependent siderophore receptor [Nisaea acidiphila]UUX48883.1 TonB-dependent siderophore receptor [Nisaea acidiphila]